MLDDSARICVFSTMCSWRFHIQCHDFDFTPRPMFPRCIHSSVTHTHSTPCDKKETICSRTHSAWVRPLRWGHSFVGKKKMWPNQFVCINLDGLFSQNFWFFIPFFCTRTKYKIQITTTSSFNNNNKIDESIAIFLKTESFCFKTIFSMTFSCLKYYQFAHAAVAHRNRYGRRTRTVIYSIYSTGIQ